MSRSFRMATVAVMLALLARKSRKRAAANLTEIAIPFPAMSAAHAHRHPHPGMAATSCLGSNRKLAPCAARTR
jgi:hypothetical protein